MSLWPYVTFYNPTLKKLAKNSKNLRQIAENGFKPTLRMTLRSIL